jgi:hypothetical protein
MRSQVIVCLFQHATLISVDDVQTPGLETSYSRFPNVDYSTINDKDLGISDIVTERQQLDAIMRCCMKYQAWKLSWTMLKTFTSSSPTRRR